MRLEYYNASPAAYKAWFAVEQYIRGCGLEHGLLHLIKLRASQINGCAFCVDMHSQEGLKDGDSVRRLFAVSAWRDTSFFSPRERAALAWTEALTRLSEQPELDAVYEDLKAHFTEKEMVDLTVAISTINGWNRLSVGFGAQPKD